MNILHIELMSFFYNLYNLTTLKRKNEVITVKTWKISIHFSIITNKLRNRFGALSRVKLYMALT